MLSLLRLLGLTLGQIAYLLGVRREVTLENLEKAYPDKPRSFVGRTARRSFANLGIVFAEMLYLRFASRQQIGRGLMIENLDEVMNSIPRSTGIVFFSGHYANWEWVAMGVGVQIDRALKVVVKNQRSGIAENFLMRMRSRFGNIMVNAADVRTMFRALKSGETLGVLGDQAATPDSVRVPFFGRNVPTFEGTGRLVLQTGAAIIFVHPICRTLTGYRIRFDLIDHRDLTEVNSDNVRELTARHTAMLEQIIREKPEFWLWQHRRWKHATD
jgi:KDO2-lipid IV(A) lauroyltransferase